MLQLVYTSIAAEAFDARRAAELCREAKLNNASVEITGLLSLRCNCFLQALEGPKVPVEDTFVRIIRDPRHHTIRLISRRLITRREFGNWSMAFYDDHDHAAAREVVARVAELAAAAPEPVRRAFMDFAYTNPLAGFGTPNR